MALLLPLGCTTEPAVPDPAVEAAAAVERTRKQVRMLDDLYKTAVVLITTHYVNDSNSLPAASAANALFDAMKQKGWHEVRLIDATGSPFLEKNAPTAGFETEAVAKLNAGEAYYDQVVERDGKSYLQAATAVPVVMEKCIMCHPNYEGVEAGKAIGALAYTLPVE